MTPREQVVAALRSGDFTQTTGVLRDETGHCCLGVACEVYRAYTGNGFWRTRASHFDFVLPDERAEILLPDAVREWLGFEYTSGYIVFPKNFFMSLTELNDGGLTFAQIADVIEWGPVGLAEDASVHGMDSDIPTFESDDAEAEFWAEHELGKGLFARMEAPPPGLLPQPRPRSKSIS